MQPSPSGAFSISARNVDVTTTSIRPSPSSFAMTDAHTTTESELEAWREAHRHVTHAVLVAKEAVAVAKAQRRYWMEEICANLTPEGKLTATSVWKKPTKAPRKTPAKRKLPENKPAPQKRRRKTEDTLTEDEAPAKNPKAKRKKKTEEEPKKKRIRLNLKKPKHKKAERIVEVYAEDADDSEGHIASSMMHAEHHYAHRGGVSPAFHHTAAYRPYAGPGKTLLPPGLMSPADPYGMMHHHVPDHLRPYMAQQPGLPMPMTPHAPTAYPVGAYASVMQGDSDDTSAEE